MNRFNVTYEIVTPESAEHGDAESRGFVAEGVGLREALELATCGDRADHARGYHIEADCCPVSLNSPPRWLTFYKVRQDFRTGAEESRAVHMPDGITAASAMRIARYVAAYGIEG